MGLESTMICVDNSEYMRNGDYIPTRLQAQQDAVNAVCRVKLMANPENSVGLLTLAKTEVLATLTTDSGKILTSLHKIQPKGYINFLTGVRIAHIALKHRQSKNHKMRIVVFVGSPIDSDEKEIIKIGKRLKKESVMVDIINFGETEKNQILLEALVNTINGKDGNSSHLVTIPPTPHLTDALRSSPLIQGEDGQANAAFSAGAGFDFVDPNEDPELALALRVSMEEQRQRQQEEERRAAQGEGGEASASTAAAAPVSMETESAAGASGTSQSEDEMLKQALAMSMEPEPDFAAMTEEEQIAYAMQLSVQQPGTSEEPMDVDEDKPSASAASKGESKDKGAAKEEMQDFSEVMADPNILNDILKNLPGVNTDNPMVQETVGSLAKDKKEKEKEKEKKDEKKDKK